MSAQVPLTLDVAVARALAVQPAMSAARARIDEAAAARGEAVAARGPLVRSSISAQQYDDPMVVSPIHGFGPGLFPPFDRTLLQASVQASYLLLDGGLRAARTAQAETQQGVADAGATATEQAVTAAVVAAWAATWSGREVLAAEVDRRAALLAERARVELRLTAGKAAEVELLRAEAALAAAEADRVRAASRVEVGERELARLLAVPPVAMAQVVLTRAAVVPLTADELADPSPDAAAMRGNPGVAAEAGGDPAGSPSGGVDPAETRPHPRAAVQGIPAPSAAERASLLARALATSPRLAQARLAVAAAEAARRVARAAYFPELRAVATVQEFGDGDLDFTTDWNAGLQLAVPLWDGGVTNRRVARAQSQGAAAAADLRQLELDVAAALDRALAAWTETAARSAALDLAAASLGEVARVEKLLRDAGAGTQVDYLAAEAELARTRAAKAEAEATALVARAEIARLVGELSPELLRGNWAPTALPGLVGGSPSPAPSELSPRSFSSPRKVQP